MRINLKFWLGEEEQAECPDTGSRQNATQRQMNTAQWALHISFLQFQACNQAAVHSLPLTKAMVHDCNLPKVTNPPAWHKHLQAWLILQLKWAEPFHKGRQEPEVWKVFYYPPAQIRTREKVVACRQSNPLSAFVPRAHTSTTTKQLQAGKGLGAFTFICLARSQARSAQ